MSLKSSAPVLGFNHNFQYQGRRYHVQTEDSGLPHAHYITHLFLGGNVVASVKTSYAGQIADPELPKIVRGLMETQHKGLVRQLMAGEFNERLGQLAGSVHYEPGMLADGTNQAQYVNTGEDFPTPTANGPVAKPAAPALAKPARPSQPIWQPSPPSASPAARQPGAPLPSVTRLPPAQLGRPPPPKLGPAPARPAAAAKPATGPTFFSESPVEMPHDDLPTLFAEELISEKSLDEVILAFLSADLEPPK